MSGGLVAVGDSIVNGHGDSMAGVPALSWTQWLADSMDLSYTRYAQGGATSTVIAEELLPRVRDTYEVGVFNMGTNDALSGLVPDVFRRNVETACARLTECCKRVLVLTVPTSTEATQIVQQVADEYGVTVVDSEVHGPRLLGADGVHPTALGHLAIASRAAAALDAPDPASLARDEGRGRLRLSYWSGYANRWLVARAKNAVRRLR